MSLTDYNTIDLVTLQPGKQDQVDLIICDGGEIQLPVEREKALQLKLGAYLQFVVSGEFKKIYPQFCEHNLRIKVICAEPPTDIMKNIEGIRHPLHPWVFLPVEVTTDSNFRRKIRAPGMLR